MVKFWRRNKLIISLAMLLLLFNVFIFFVWMYTHTFDGIITISNDLGKSLVTIDTVLIGFSYTALNTMLAFSNNNDFNIIDRDGYIDKYYNGVYISIALFFVAMFVGVITAFSNLGLKHHWLFMLQFLINFDALSFFGITIIKFRSLINWVRERKIEKLNKSA